MISTVYLENMMNNNLINTIALKTIKPYEEYINNTKLPLMGLNSSTKVFKGLKKYKYNTSILYLQPANTISKRTLCAYSSVAGCEDDCLGKTSGRMVMNSVQLAMTRRTVQYISDPDGFKERLRSEILKSESDNYCVRLNGTSDEDWSDLISSMPNVQFYDYTKVLHRVERNKLSNYHLTYSASMNNAKCINSFKKAIAAQLNTVISFNTKEAKGEFKIPESIVVAGKTIKLTSFDDTDLRFLDDDGAVGALKRKGSKKETRLAEIGTANFFADLENIKLAA